MFRQFKFEAETYCEPDCVPMAVRRKLDRVGLKVGLEQWRGLGEGERLALRHLPAEQKEEVEVFRTFVTEAVQRVSGRPPTEIGAGQRAAADPPAELPAELIQAADGKGVKLTQAMWAELDGDQRYALMKLGMGTKANHNLRPAMEEFFGSAGAPERSLPVGGRAA